MGVRDEECSEVEWKGREGWKEEKEREGKKPSFDGLCTATAMHSTATSQAL